MILCIVKILVMSEVKQPSLNLAPASLGQSGSVSVGLGSRISQVQFLSLIKNTRACTHTHTHAQLLHVVYSFVVKNSNGKN